MMKMKWWKKMIIMKDNNENSNNVKIIMKMKWK